MPGEALNAILSSQELLEQSKREQEEQEIMAKELEDTLNAQERDDNESDCD